MESISYKVWKKKFLLKIQNSYKNYKLLYKKWEKFSKNDTKCVKNKKLLWKMW